MSKRNPRVALMNEATSEDKSLIPLPALEQLGEVDRSVYYEDGDVKLVPVTYHLPAVPAPAPNVGGPDAEQSAVQQESAAAPSGEADDLAAEVPDGSVQTVLRWVGDDKDRARAALERENARQDPRSSLISQLNDRI